MFAHEYVAPRSPLFLVREHASEEPRSAVVEAADPHEEEDDALEELADEITTLAAHIHAATQRLLELIAEFDRRGGWKAGGHRSCAHWLAFRTRIDLGTAREKVRTARVLVGLPATSASMARGELSFSAVRALTRVATPETETDLLELARGCTTAQLERVVRSWRTGSRATEAERERERYERRRFSVFPDEDGMYLLRGRVPAEVGALLMRAVEAASDALYRENRGRDGLAAEAAESSPSTPDDSRAEAARRRADALALVAERALSAGFGGCATGSRDRGPDHDMEAGAASGTGARTAPPISGTRAERYQIMVHVSPGTLSADEEPGRSHDLHAVANGSRETLSEDAEAGRSDHPNDGANTSRETRSDDAEPARSTHPDDGADAPCETRSAGRGLHPLAVADASPETHSSDQEPCRSHLDDGTRLAPETSRRLACDAARVTVARTQDGSVLNVGRRARTVSPALRRALEVRDRGCRFPGCGMRFTDAHHVRHWADGGATSLGNCLLLCRHHHRLMHEGGWSIEWWGDGRPAFFDPRGQAHFEGRWNPPELGEDPVEALVAANRGRGADPDWRTAGARWKREADIPPSVYFQALEATG